MLDQKIDDRYFSQEELALIYAHASFFFFESVSFSSCEWSPGDHNFIICAYISDAPRNLPTDGALIFKIIAEISLKFLRSAENFFILSYFDEILCPKGAPDSFTPLECVTHIVLWPANE